MATATRPRPASERTVYLDDFGLVENPFRTTPSARYTYLTPSTREAIAHGRHVVEARRGLGAISGEIGTGKTTLARLFGEEAADEKLSIASLYRVPGGSKQTEAKMIAAIAMDLGLPSSSGRSAEKAFAAVEDAAIRAHGDGRTTVILIDEAHKLRDPSLDVIKSLLMLQTDDAQLVQILLFGQLPEMTDVLTRDPALHSRLAVHTRLNPMVASDVRHMIAHRLKQAGRDEPLFDKAALTALYETSRGIPRKICTIADRSALFAWDESKKMVEREHVIRAAADLLHEPLADG